MTIGIAIVFYAKINKHQIKNMSNIENVSRALS